MDPAEFLTDVEAKPAHLRRLASVLDDGPDLGVDLDRVERVVLTGLGSSRFAARDAARELRRAGVVAWCDYSSTPLGPLSRDTLLVAVSASGRTPETVAAAERPGDAQVLAVSNRMASPLADRADSTVLVHAGPETSGGVTASMSHTILMLRCLTDQLTGRSRPLGRIARAAAASIEHLLSSRSDWLDRVCELLDSPDGVHFIAAADRSASAAQSALVMRETARRPSTACEAADWSHVDVYLTRSRDYRAVLLGPSPHYDGVFEWTRPRRSTVLSWGAGDERSDACVRFPGDDDPEIGPLVDTLLAELVGLRWFDRAEQ